MRNIYICTNEFPTEDNFDGGVGNHFYRYAKILKKNSFNPIVITSSKYNGIINYRGIKVVRVKVFNLIVRIVLKLTQKYGFKGEIYPRPIFALYQSLILNKKINKVLKNDEVIIYSSYQYLNFFQKKNFKSLVVIWSLQKEWNFVNPNSIKQKIDTYLERKSFESARSMISVSRLLYKKLDKNLKKKTHVIFPVFDKKKIKYESFRKIKKLFNINFNYILYFGSLIERKGIFLISKVIKKILKKNKNIHFLFVGSDSKQNFKSAKKKILNENYEIQNKIHFLPVLRHDFLHPIIKNAKITVMPTYIDTSPSASLEAMSNGGIILGSNKSSLDEYIINNKNGFLFENGKVNSLEKQILKILKISKSKILKIRKKTKKDLRIKFSSKNIKNFINVIKNLDEK